MQVSMLASAGFRVEHAVVHTPGVNSPFEAIVIGRRGEGVGEAGDGFWLGKAAQVR
jgi:hypothetical protein